MLLEESIKGKNLAYRTSREESLGEELLQSYIGSNNYSDREIYLAELNIKQSTFGIFEIENNEVYNLILQEVDSLFEEDINFVRDSRNLSIIKEKYPILCNKNYRFDFYDKYGYWLPGYFTALITMARFKIFREFSSETYVSYFMQSKIEPPIIKLTNEEFLTYNQERLKNSDVHTAEQLVQMFYKEYMEAKEDFADGIENIYWTLDRGTPSSEITQEEFENQDYFVSPSLYPGNYYRPRN